MREAVQVSDKNQASTAGGASTEVAVVWVSHWGIGWCLGPLQSSDYQYGSQALAKSGGGSG